MIGLTWSREVEVGCEAWKTQLIVEYIQTYLFEPNSGSGLSNRACVGPRSITFDGTSAPIGGNDVVGVNVATDDVSRLVLALANVATLGLGALVIVGLVGLVLGALVNVGLGAILLGLGAILLVLGVILLGLGALVGNVITWGHNTRLECGLC